MLVPAGVRGAGARSRLAMRRLGLLLLALPAFCTAAMAQDVRTSPSEVLGNAEFFDGKTVTVSGAVLNLHEAVATGGKHSYSFDLTDGTETVHVFSAGSARCKAGAATVDGTFDRARQQVFATRVRCR
jgi:hypothetical protein